MRELLRYLSYSLLISVLVLSIPIVVFFIISAYMNTSDNFPDLPLGATNGQWSERLMQDRPQQPVDIPSLMASNAIIVRVVVSHEHTMPIHRYRYGDNSSYNVHSIYRVDIVDVFNGDWVNDTSERVMQFKRLGDPTRRNRHFSAYTSETQGSNFISRELIRVPIAVGDDLILILDPTNTISQTVPRLLRLDTLTGIYYYTPQELRGGNENYAFTPVNPHNNIVLTAADLQELRSQR